MVKLMKNKTITNATIISLLLLIIDQITKIIVLENNVSLVIIPNVLEVQAVKNTGGAFGVGEGNILMFIISNIVVLGLIIRFIYLQKDYMDKMTLYSLFVVLAGGFGNFIDRIFRGFVVDFINILPSINFPKFNFADVYITIGWIIFAFVFALYSFREIKSNKSKE